MTIVKPMTNAKGISIPLALSSNSPVARAITAMQLQLEPIRMTLIIGKLYLYFFNSINLGN